MTATTTWATLISLSVNNDYSLELVFNSFLIAGASLILIAIVIFRWWCGWRGPDFTIDTIEIGVGSHKMSFKPNQRDQEIAYKIWVELSTRKIGLKIDLRHDVVSEIYDSWHNFFTITRELIKDIPVNKVKNHSTRQIITLSIGVLNEGLRPHLTSWQARFRRWYDIQLTTAKSDADPQSIQSAYPKFKELESDLMLVNQRLIKYREKMRYLVLGDSDETTNIPQSTDQEPTL